MTDLYIDFLNVMAGGGLFLIVVFWFVAYFFVNFRMTNRHTMSGDDIVKLTVGRKYHK